MGRGMEDPVQGRELSLRIVSQEPRRSYLEARASGSQQGTHRWEVQYIVCKAGSEFKFKEKPWHLAAVLVKAHSLACLSLRDSICEMGIMVPMSLECMNA